jgi:hypothetical protein
LVLPQSSSASLDVFQHRFPEHLIQPGLMALSLPAEPGHHVGIQAHGELPLRRPIIRIADGVLPEAFSERRMSETSISESGRAANWASLRLRAAVIGLSVSV